MDSHVDAEASPQGAVKRKMADGEVAPDADANGVGGDAPAPPAGEADGEGNGEAGSTLEPPSKKVKMVRAPKPSFGWPV